jgi:thymidylate synthase
MSINHFYKILTDVLDHGKTVVSRGLETKELIGYTYNLPPRVRFMCFEARKLKMDYIKQEFLWYLLGEPRDHSICKAASMWKELINADKTINSNYGFYIFNPAGGADGQSNLDRVTTTLQSDPHSRRATMLILNTAHLNSVTKDYPCTVYINFLIRDNKLNMFVRMRSQDAIYGMGNDAPFFSFVHELLLWKLKEKDPVLFENLHLGNYQHSADSFHVYERHYDMLENIIKSPVVATDEHDNCPEMTRFTPHYVAVLRDELTRQKPRLEGLDTDPFVKWLLTRDDEESLIMPDTYAV